MNWYQQQKHRPVVLAVTRWEIGTAAPPVIPNHSSKIIKLAYSSKKHDLLLPKQNSDDGCMGHITLSESKNKISIEAALYTRLYSFPLFEEVWYYDKTEMRRAVRTFNHIVHAMEDLKADAEEVELPTPSVQAKCREELRYVDVDRKRPMHNASLRQGRNEAGEGDWRNSLYGSRYPSPQISISNNGTINIINDRAQ